MPAGPPPPRCPQELRSSLGLVCHSLHLLAGVGMPMESADLEGVCAYLRRHTRELSPKQKAWLRGAFEAWGFTQHGLRLRGGGGARRQGVR